MPRKDASLLTVIPYKIIEQPYSPPIHFHLSPANTSPRILHPHPPFPTFIPTPFRPLFNPANAQSYPTFTSRHKHPNSGITIYYIKPLTMQRLSMIALTATAVLGLSGTGFSSKPASASTPNQAPTQATSPTGKNAAFATSYYWYSALDGSYNDYESVAYEIWEMEVEWGVTVDQHPAGGTLLEEGFLTNNPGYPVMIWLYGHF